MLFQDHPSGTPPSTCFAWIAPSLAAVYPVLSVYRESTLDIKFADAAVCGIVLFTAALATTYLMGFIFSDIRRASLAAVVCVAWTFTYARYVRFGKLVLE